MSQDILHELWLPVPKTEGFYEASDFGRLRSWKNFGRRGGRREHPRIMKPTPDDGGYLKVGICIGGKVTRMYVHRIVAETFHGECPPGMEVRHVHGNKLDNRPAKLIYGTKQQNEADKVAHGTATRGERGTKAILSNDAVRSIRGFIEDGWTHWFIGRLFGVSRPTITAISTGKNWSHEGKVDG